MRRIATLSLLLLSACASPQEREAQLANAAGNRCIAAGVRYGTPAYGNCVAAMMHSIEQRRAIAGYAALGYGATLMQPTNTHVTVAPMTCTRVIPGTVRCY